MIKINELNAAYAFLSVGALGFISGLFTSKNMNSNEYILNKNKQNTLDNKIKKYDNLITNC